jgi:hypothetical protein
VTHSPTGRTTIEADSSSARGGTKIGAADASGAGSLRIRRRRAVTRRDVERRNDVNDVNDDNDDDFGGGFWLKLVGLIAAAVIGVGIVLALFTHIWSKWGFLAAFIAFGGLLLLIAYIYDRRERNRRKGLAA